MLKRIEKPISVDIYKLVGRAIMIPITWMPIPSILPAR